MGLTNEKMTQNAFVCLELNPDGIHWIDETGTILYVNAAMCQLLGYRKEELLGMHIADINPQMHPTCFGKDCMNTEKMQEQGRLRFQAKLRHKDAHLIPVEISAIAQDLQGEVLFFCFVHDITAHEQAESRLRKEIFQKTQAETKLTHINETLKNIAYTDLLTNLKTRRYFFEMVRKEVSRINRYNHKLSLLLIDVDHFKQINDNYGHLTGDAVLKKIGALLQSNIRKADSAIRWGGEEFVLFLPEIGLENACFLADRLREMIYTCDFEIDRNVSVSIGVSEYGAEETVDSWIMKADRALYRAKRNGRNRVCCYDAEQDKDILK